jgi:hypothetical protein
MEREGCKMSAVPKSHSGQNGDEALQPTELDRGDRRNQDGEARTRSSGSAQIASVVLPFLAKVKSDLHGTKLRLDYGTRKFDVSTRENWSVYFRLVNTKSHKASDYYIVDLSSRSPLIIITDSLDVGATGRRREVWGQAVQSHDDITEQILAKLLDRAEKEAGQK